MIVLGIETSCDETSAALVSDNFKVLSQVVLSQKEHSEFGGVVPEIASRLHTQNIQYVADRVFKQANLRPSDIDGIAVTYGPGLVGSLIVGLMFAKALAVSLKKTFIGINHLEGHMFSVFLTYPELRPPILFLLVSGGHTEIILMKDFFDYTVLGTTMDDAAGECFDKVSRQMDIPYPGGPVLDRLAVQGDENFYRFPVAHVKGFNLSFSGLKTSVLYYIKNHTTKFVEQHKNDIVASFQKAAVDMLCNKLMLAQKKTGVSKIAVVGGVSNNTRLKKACSKAFGKFELYFPLAAYTTDNAAMIGAVGNLRIKKGESSSMSLGAVPDLYL